MALASVLMIMVAIRLLFAILPLPGYLHPDEFFQSTEVVAGDILDIKVHRPWEFTTKSPIRSITFPYLMAAPPIMTVRSLCHVLHSFTGACENYVPSDWLLRATRIWMALLSFVVDICLLHLCRSFKVNGRHAFVIYCSSFVTQTMFCRTLSNTLETLFFALLVNYLSLAAFYKPDSEERREPAAAGSNGVASYIQVAAIVSVLGFFNRPTFLAFAAVPWCFWFVKSVSSSGCGRTFEIMFRASLYFILTSVILIQIDSYYYGTFNVFNMLFYEDHSLANILQTMMKKSVVTPLNFINYNTKPKNLADHGLHPHYTHLTLNSIVLFGVLYLAALFTALKYLIGRGDSSKRESRIVLFLTFITPLLLLSPFPHQEARFIFPLLIPCILLGCEAVRSSKFLTTMWLAVNILASVFFGFFHQGGLVLASFEIQREICDNPMKAPTHLVFWNTYMPPHHLFMCNKDSKAAGNQTIKFRDLKSKDLRKVEEELSYIFQKIQLKLERGEQVDRLYFVAPGSLTHMSTDVARLFGLKQTARIFPHFSSEAPPLPYRGVVGLRNTLEHVFSLMTLDVFLLDIETLKQPPEGRPM